MEEIKENAKAYYKASPEVKQSAKEFFDEMVDSNKNKRVKLKEYKLFMERQGHIRMCNDEFFNLLDVGRKGYLEFWDVMTLYYILMSGRPFCDLCENFIMGTFFSCVKCFEDSKFAATSPTFELCSNCFLGKKYRHDHKEFLDNFLLLEFIRDGSKFDKKNNPQAHTKASNPVSSSSRKAKTKSSSSKAIAPASNPQHKTAKYQRSASSSSSRSRKRKETSSSSTSADRRSNREAKLQTGIQLVQLVANLGSMAIASSCTIL